jgi:dihydrodipicolinate synthase/N-acetylneuraminate lyase
MSKLTGGVMPASLTCWNEDGSFNREGQEKYWQWLLDNGVDGLSVCGSTGENMAMTMDEQKEIIKAACEFVNGRVPVYAGTGKYSTAQTIELSQYAEKCGADGVMVINPYYFTPYKRAVLNHFREVKKNIGIDILIYNNPWFAGYELTAKEVKVLVDEGVIGSVKAAHGDSNRCMDLKFECGDKLVVMYGHDYEPVQGLVARADGWLSGLPAAFPKFCTQLFKAVKIDGDVNRAVEMWQDMIPFMNYFYTYKTNDPHWLEIFKYVVECQGLTDIGLARKPLGEIKEEEKAKIRKTLEPLQKYF